MTILTGSATGNIFFNDGSGNDGVVQYVHSSDPNYFRIASSGHVRFDAAALWISDVTHPIEATGHASIFI